MIEPRYLPVPLSPFTLQLGKIVARLDYGKFRLRRKTTSPSFTRPMMLENRLWIIAASRKNLFRSFFRRSLLLPGFPVALQP